MNSRSRFDCTPACVAALSCLSLSRRNDEYSRSVSCVGAEGDEERGHDRQQRDEPQVPDQQQQADPGARAHPGASGERRDQRGDERRHHERRPDAIVLAEQDPRGGRARDQHQLARVRHVQAEQPPRTLAEMVELEDAELDDADDGADRADGDDDVDDRQRAAAGQQPVRDRHDGEEQQLFAVDDAGFRDRRRTRRRRASRRRTPPAARTSAALRSAPAAR